VWCGLGRHAVTVAPPQTHGHVVHAVQEVPFWAPFDAVFDTSCLGNEGCAVKQHFSPCLMATSLTTPNSYLPHHA
jgi:hypothetical protein